MTAILFGLATGIAYGTHDFFGGIASRRSSPLAVVALFKLVGLLTLVLTIPFVSGAPTTSAMTWGAAAGVAIGLGNVAYFRALSIGRMGIISTITATWSAVVPLVAGVATGERPDPLAWAGIMAVIASIALITYTPGSAVSDQVVLPDMSDSLSPQSARQNPAGAGLIEATIAGVGFGVFFVALSQASGVSSGLVWPLLAATGTAALLVGSTALSRRVEWRPAFSQWPAIIAAGVLYAGANWSFILGVNDGWVSIVAVLAALSPLPTILFARLILSETLSRVQVYGVAVALTGVVLITLGVSD